MKLFFKFALLSTFVLLFFAGCKKDPLTHFPVTPIANGGNSQSVNLPICTVTLTGSGTSANGKIVGYIWSLTSGPNVPVIESPSSPVTVISGLTAGTYIFQFAVIDSIGLTGVDTVSVVVIPSPHKIVTLQPSNNLYEGLIDSYSPNSPISNGDTQFDITAWTANGSSENQRSAIKIDFAGVPQTAVIDSAVLYLFAAPVPHGGNNTDANYGNANAGFIQRILNVWPTTNTGYTWNTPPSVTTSNQVVIPQSTSSTSNTILNVTLLVRDMQQFGNNGFFLKLQSEQTYNIQQFASSFNLNAAVHPKLVLWYH